MFNFKFICSATAFVLLPQVVYADCVTPPDCSTLGYTMNVADCDTSKPILKCAADTSKVFCSKKETEQVIPCKVGSILYSDKKCYNNASEDRIPIAVVFDAAGRLAVALEQESLKWQDAPSSSNLVDIPGLTNIEYESEARSDLNGEANTKVIYDYCKANRLSCPAAKYCYEYKTAGTVAGDWHLPAAGELVLMYQNKDAVNTTLANLGGTSVFGSDNLWSSSENSFNIAWLMITSGSANGIYYNFKFKYYGVRPVLAF